MTVYLTEKEIIFINVLVITKINSKEQVRVKEPAALDMCLAQPKQFVFGKELYPELEEKAAILFELLINKHCFFNGNKRTAAVSLAVFLKKNNRILICSDKELVDFAIKVAEKKGAEKLTNEEIAAWIKQHSSTLD